MKISLISVLVISLLWPGLSRAGTLLQFDFNDPAPWQVTSQKPSAPGVMAGNVGTVEKADGIEGSPGLMLIVNDASREGWTSSIQSGPIALKNAQTQLGKLTLAFDLQATRALPVRLRIESLDANQAVTGALETILYPAAADYFQRHAVEFSTFTAVGNGAFDPAAPFIAFTYEIRSTDGWPAETRHEVRLDNVHLATPAYYVSAKGADTADGLTEATAFASPQRVMEAAQPGDIVVIMEGTYTRRADLPEKSPVAKFIRSGTPAGWITLKNYPGHKPVISSHGQTGVSLKVPWNNEPDNTLILCYLEVRGLHIRGNGDTAREQYPAELGKFSPNTSSMGIVVNGRRNGHTKPRVPGEMIHHIRLADNTVEFCTAEGIYAEYADWLQIERNLVKDNCWTTPGYAPAGLSVMGYSNFDAQDNIFKILIVGNTVCGNKLTVFNDPFGKEPKTGFFNGNGILLDANAEIPPAVYLGRTLVQNNLVFNNGAGGIQMWGSHRLDLINNTIYRNGNVLKWGQVGLERCSDVRLINNVIVGQPDGPLDRWSARGPDKRTAGILRMNNLYHSGVLPNIEGVNDQNGDPLFINPGADPATADFRLHQNSPARKAGRWETFSPALDVTGKPRPPHGSPSIGALE